MKSDKQKNCTNPSHINKPVTQVCVKEDCEYESRFQCIQCHYSENTFKHFQNHQNNFLMIDEIIENSHSSYITNWPLSDIVQNSHKHILEFYLNHRADVPSEIVQIQKFFKEFTTTLVKEINYLEQQLITLIQKQNEQSKVIINQISPKIEEFMDFDNLKQIIYNYLKEQKDEAQTSILIKDEIKSKRNLLTQDQIQQFQKHFEKFKVDKIDLDMLPIYSQQIIQKLQEFKQSFQQNPFQIDLQDWQKIPNNKQYCINIDPKTDKFFQQNDEQTILKFQPSENFYDSTDNIKIDDNKYILDHKLGQKYRLMHSQKFGKNDKLAIKLKVTLQQPNFRGNIVLKLHSWNNKWDKTISGSDGLYIYSGDQKNENFEVENRTLQNILKIKNEVILNFLIDVEKNIFIMMDEDKQTIYWNVKQLEESLKNQWCFGICAFNKTQIEVLTFKKIM